jgi:coenzyme F420 hydrogenase subunit beta
MLHQIKTLKDVVDWGLCTGCGACQYSCRKGGVTLVNIPSLGIRPKFLNEECANCTECLKICPGYQVNGTLQDSGGCSRADGYEDIGPVLEVWEGHASDPEIRYKGSSGGVLTALAVYCLEHEGMTGVLHTDSTLGESWKNRTVLSSSREEVLSCAGSRYAPAAPCEGLNRIEVSEGQCVFIGKPCDAAAVTMLRRERPGLSNQLGLVLTFFCAGTPSTKGTLDLLQSIDVNAQEVSSLNYRGEGWPGNFRVKLSSESGQRSMTYDESWSKLTSYRPLRCNLCPDGLGRLADISCGDAWHAYDQNGNPGRSLVLVRTARGKEILERAMAAGYVTLVAAKVEAVRSAQPGLLQRRKELFGRLLALRLLMIPVPRFSNFFLFHSWLRLPMKRKAITIAGTFRRALVRGWWRPHVPLD